MDFEFHGEQPDPYYWENTSKSNSDLQATIIRIYTVAYEFRMIEFACQ